MSSTVSSAGPEPLIRKESAVARHLKSMGDTLGVHVYGSVGAKLDADWQMVPLVAGLVDGQCEYVARRRGRRVPVAPMLRLGGELWVWFSYREEWDRERPGGRTRRFTFRSAGLTIFLGCRNSQYKAQMLRAEWSGLARWNGDEYDYLGRDAAHPHWHFDAVEVRRGDAAAGETGTFLDAVEGEAEEAEAREFGSRSTSLEQIPDLATKRDMGRIHFPSAAAWWEDPPRNTHVHSPGSPKQIQAWAGNTLEYLVREFDRLWR